MVQPVFLGGRYLWYWDGTSNGRTAVTNSHSSTPEVLLRLIHRAHTRIKTQSRPFSDEHGNEVGVLQLILLKRSTSPFESTAASEKKLRDWPADHSVFP